jgi:CxxC-x17-CxxC domain-containing protein
MEFTIMDADVEFLNKISPTFNGKKYQIPPPTFCPDCRQQRRLCWRNERNLYKRKCDATGAEIISNISQDKPFKVYEREYWLSDKWNALDYGRDFDFSKTFTENFAALQKEVPRFSLQQQNPMENSIYCSFASNCKNSYFLFDSDFCEDCLYGNVMKNSSTCADCSFILECEICYECINCKNCYDLKFSRNCVNCSNSIFIESCIGCRNCAFSTNLHDKEYFFANEKYSKEEYEKKITELDIDEYENLNEYLKYCEEFLRKHPRRFMQGTQNQNVNGDYVYNSRDIYRSFNIVDCWDVRYSQLLYKAKDCCDVSSFGENIEEIYEVLAAGLNSHSSAFSSGVVLGSNNIFYSDIAYSSKYCFGCVSLNRNEYCILNKQYTKNEYGKMVAKIIEHMIKTGEWGEFLHHSLSSVTYNESVALDYFPLIKEKALERGFKWKDKEKKDYLPQKYVVPQTLGEVMDSILNEILACESCGKNYKIVEMELGFYRKIHTPIPKKCPDCRHKARLQLKNPRKLWDRDCAKCGAEIATSFSPDRGEMVYCEKCYLDATM